MDTYLRKNCPVEFCSKESADKVLAGLIKITTPSVKGAHDSHMVIAAGKAYIVYEANDYQPGENAKWPFVYCALTIVDIQRNTVEKTIKFAYSSKIFENHALPSGACFVPRIVQKNQDTLRCYFTSENPDVRDSQVWYIDFDCISQSFLNHIHKVQLETSLGIFDMTPKPFFDQALLEGYSKEYVNFSLYIFDVGKRFDGKCYLAVNNFFGKINALGVFNEELDTIRILGFFIKPIQADFSESAVIKTPDGRWLAIMRNDTGDRNYVFSESEDGHVWTEAAPKELIGKSAASKPTFDKFNNTYYLGWQQDDDRTIFNIDVSVDCKKWERKYSFSDTRSFQYPTFVGYQEEIYLCVTMGDSNPGSLYDANEKKQFIMFGKLE